MSLMQTLALCTLAVLGTLTTLPAGAHGLRAGPDSGIEERTADQVDRGRAAAASARMVDMHTHSVSAVGGAAAAGLEAGEGARRRLLHRGCHRKWCMPWCSRCSRGGHCRRRGKVFRCNRDDDEENWENWEYEEELSPEEREQREYDRENPYGEVTSGCGVPFADVAEEEDEFEFPEECGDDAGVDYDYDYWQIDLGY